MAWAAPPRIAKDEAPNHDADAIFSLIQTSIEQEGQWHIC